LLPRGKESFLGHVLTPAHAAAGAIGQRANQGLIPFNDPAKGLAASVQAVGYQIGVGWFCCGHGLEFHHITLYVPEKAVWVTENLPVEAAFEKPTLFSRLVYCRWCRAVTVSVPVPVCRCHDGVSPEWPLDKA
jgi:hypothetical protein